MSAMMPATMMIRNKRNSSRRPRMPARMAAELACVRRGMSGNGVLGLFVAVVRRAPPVKTFRFTSELLLIAH